MKRKKRKQIHLRLTIEEWANASAFAEHAGLNIPNALRLLIRCEIESANNRTRLERRAEALATTGRIAPRDHREDVVARRIEAPPSDEERKEINVKLTLDDWATAATIAEIMGVNIPTAMRRLLAQGIEEESEEARRRLERRARELVAEAR